MIQSYPTIEGLTKLGIRCPMRGGLVTGRRLAVKNQALEWIGLLFVAVDSVEIATEY